MTHPGARRPINEDALLELPHQGLWAVADGMGGHSAGQMASAMVIDALSKVPEADNLEARVETVIARLLDANDRLRRTAAESFAGKTVGSTVVAMVANGLSAACIWAGDSRLYQFRSGGLTQVSHDHSEVQQLVDLGLIAPSAANHHPLSGLITRAIGGRDDLEVESQSLDLQPGDIYLLCSDGLTRMVSEEEIGPVLAECEPEEAVKALMHLALVRKARDNVTLIVIGVPG